jgi:mono/diheme cytochrome c family protein
MSLAFSGCKGPDADLPEPYRRLAVPEEVLASKDARARGHALFRQHCALCHGDRADGRGVRREGLTSPPRDFTDPAWRRSTSPRHVFFAIREGRPGTPMPAWKALDAGETWALTAYVLAAGETP